MNIFAFVKQFESRVASAVAVEASVIADELRRDIPSNRTLTRQAVKVRRLTRHSVEIALNFQRRYPSKNTETHRLLKRSWATIRPIARQRFVSRLNESLTR
jgi:hypothetical protein